MAVEIENVEKLQEWLVEGSSVRAEVRAAEALADQLADLVFQGDQEWPNYADRAAGYRDALRAWFTQDSGRESQFVALTGPSAEGSVFVAWFLPVVQEWASWAARNESGQAGGEGTVVGLVNPNSDGTPGTEYYRFDEATAQYLYSSSAGGDWATYEKRRYAEVERDENYGLDYRYDRKDSVYEWYDEAEGTWRDQAWADLDVARRHERGPAAEKGGGGAAPEWDENWNMFYRVGPGGVYEFADAVQPGAQASGCGDVWLSHEQVLMRQSRAQSPSPSQAREPSAEPGHQEVGATLQEAFRNAAQDLPDLAEGDEELLAAEILKLLEA